MVGEHSIFQNILVLFASVIYILFLFTSCLNCFHVPTSVKERKKSVITGSYRCSFADLLKSDKMAVDFTSNSETEFRE